MLSTILSRISSAHAQDTKRFSVSVGWLGITSLGKAQPFQINTGVKQGTASKVGLISGKTINDNIDQSRRDEMSGILLALLETKSLTGGQDQYLIDDLLKAGALTPDPAAFYQPITGTAKINGLEAWTSNAGLEVEDVNTVGLMFNYNLNNNISIQFIGGIPPKVDLKGKGQIYAPFSASAKPLAGTMGELFLKNDLLITDLDRYDTAASARAWTPAVELQYYLGKPGVNKFRPFVGAGVMYAYFNDISINSGIEQDLIAAGHMIQNIYDNKAGSALDQKVSSGDINVSINAEAVFAPIVSAGFTYDIKENWFATASVSYVKLDNTATITVDNKSTGAQLIKAKTKIDIDPLISYVGLGYRF